MVSTRYKPLYKTWSKHAKNLGVDFSEEFFIENFSKIKFTNYNTRILEFYTDRYSSFVVLEKIKEYFERTHKELFEKRGSSYDIGNIMRRHGCTESEAIEKIKELKNKTSGTLENFIKRHGQEEGLRRFEIFKTKSMSSEDNFIKKIWRN